MVQEIKDTTDIDLLKRKLEIMVVGRLRKKVNILKAIKIQDNLSKKSGSWKGSEEIRKWREKI